MNRQPASVENATPGDFRQALGVIFLLTCTFFFNFFARAIPAPLMLPMERDLGISHSQAGELFLTLTLGYCTSLLCSGFIASRVGHRNTILLSASGLGPALILMAMSSGYPSALCAALLIGAATGMYLPSGIATMTSLVNPAHWGKALSIHELAPNVSLCSAPLVAEILFHWFSWRGILFIAGSCALLMAGIFHFSGAGDNSRGVPLNVSRMMEFARLPSFWIMVVCLGLAIGSSLGVYTMLPLYLVESLNIPRSEANTLLSFSRVAGIFTGFLGGWMADRFGARNTMRLILTTTGVLTILLGWMRDDWLVVLVFLQPAASVCFFPAAFSALPRIGGADTRNLSVALAAPMSLLIGAGLVPAVIGVMGDAGKFRPAFASVGIALLCASTLLWRLKLTETSGR